MLEPKLSVYDFLIPMPFVLPPPSPPSSVFGFVSVRVRKQQPWSLESGFPPSTLSRHLSLKNEYEEKSTATFVQGRRSASKRTLGARKGRDALSLPDSSGAIALQRPQGRGGAGGI